MISIVMPVYNAEQYVVQCIESVLAQSFTDYEFIIVDDGSTDRTFELIEAFDDSRIVLVKNKHDYIGSLNLGLNRAKGEYIARIDADDIMQPDRLKVQYHIMETEPSIIVCSSWFIPFSDDNNFGSIRGDIGFGLVENPLRYFLRHNIIAHPTVMMRREFIEKHHLQYEDYAYAEDYKFWIEMAKLGAKFYIEPQHLIKYRTYDRKDDDPKLKTQRETSLKIQIELLDYLIEKNTNYTSLSSLKEAYKQAIQEELMTEREMLLAMSQLLSNNESLF